MVTIDFLVICERVSTSRGRLDVFGAGTGVYSLSAGPAKIVAAYQLRYTSNDLGSKITLDFTLLDADGHPTGTTARALTLAPITSGKGLDGMLQTCEQLTVQFTAVGPYTFRITEGGARLAEARLDVMA